MGKQKLTDEQKALYMSSGGSYCPYCESQDIEGGDRTVNDGLMIQGVICHSCLREWDDVYKLIDVYEF